MGRALLERAGVGALHATEGLIQGLPQVSGSGQQVQAGRELVQLLQKTEKGSQQAGVQFIASRCSCSRWPTRLTSPAWRVAMG